MSKKTDRRAPARKPTARDDHAKETRPIVKKFRVTPEESELWERAARLVTEGNVSSFVRKSANVAARAMLKAELERRKATGNGHGSGPDPSALDWDKVALAAFAGNGTSP